MHHCCIYQTGKHIVMSNILKIQNSKADAIGIMASSLCLIHCIATPFVFITHACVATTCSATPAWWKLIDYTFLIVALIAIYFATKHSIKKWVRITLWLSWTLLAAIILNESLHLIPIPHWFIYIPSLSIVFLHFYNRKYCHCTKDKCCSA